MGCWFIGTTKLNSSNKISHLKKSAYLCIAASQCIHYYRVTPKYVSLPAPGIKYSVNGKHILYLKKHGSTNI